LCILKVDKVNLDCPNRVLFNSTDEKINDESTNKFSLGIPIQSASLPTHKDFARDIGVFLGDQEFSHISEEDPIKMMTRKSEREKERKRRKSL
jgi:hypothetical protein